MLTTPDLFEDLGHALATDYFFLREQLTERQLETLRRVRTFVDDEVLPVIGGYWERAEMPWPLIRRLGEMGIVGEDIHGYGCPGKSTLLDGFVTMELARIDFLLRTRPVAEGFDHGKATVGLLDMSVEAPGPGPLRHKHSLRPSGDQPRSQQ